MGLVALSESGVLRLDRSTAISLVGDGEADRSTWERGCAAVDMKASARAIWFREIATFSSRIVEWTNIVASELSRKW
jgi:hypothetical protein